MRQQWLIGGALLKVSIGVTAYNEAANIGPLLEALVGQQTSEVEIDEILVVSSGSTDGTDEIVRHWEKKCSSIRLLRQPRREGKASAVNLFLREASNEILILESADTLPLPTTIELLVRPLLNERVGMTGAHPVPVNGSGSLIGEVVRLMWELHHRLALESPKLGEMVAFRKVITHIPRESAVDEASLEAAIRRAGLDLVYVPEAIVLNKGPEHVGEFLDQRRRIHAGHLWLQRHQDYQVSTHGITRILKHLIRVAPRSERGFVVVSGTMLLEAVGRALGWLDFRVLGKNPCVWKVATTTKNLARQTKAKERSV